MWKNYILMWANEEYGKYKTLETAQRMLSDLKNAGNLGSMWIVEVTYKRV